MKHKQTLHIVDTSSRFRAEQARQLFDLGHHCEVYDDIFELLAIPPERGIILVRDKGESNGVESVLTALEAKGIWLPVIALADNPQPAAVVTAIKAGALDYLSLPLDGARLRQSIDLISQEAAAYGIARRKLVEARNRMAALSPREREVLDWLAEGCSNKMIARELDISPRTVEIHRANMMVKIGASHVSEAVRLRIEAGSDARLALAS